MTDRDDYWSAQRYEAAYNRKMTDLELTAGPLDTRCLAWIETVDPHTGNRYARQCARSSRPDSAFCWQHEGWTDW